MSKASLAGVTSGEEIGLETFPISHQDAADMARLGKAQQFRRNFSFWSTMGFVSIYMATWEFSIVSMSPVLPLTGYGGFFWTFLGCMLLYGTVVLSLAEMSSMSPTAGGQYHWVSEFAPAGWQKGMSYAAGWMSSLGWIASLAGGTYACADLVGVCVGLAQGMGGDESSFSFAAWQLFLVILALLLVTIALNTLGAGFLPALEVVSLVGHTAGFVVFVGVLWGLCGRAGTAGGAAGTVPLNTAREVFLSWENGSGWGDYGAACLVAQVSIIWSMLGSDTIVHISEEVRDASLVVPQAMWWSYVLNSGMAFVMVITMLFCIGPFESIVDADLPYLNLFSNTGRDSAALFLAVMLLILIYAGNITALAATSREVWAFARDKGFPFSAWISHIDRRYGQPFNAVYLSTLISILISLVSLGSSLAFNIIASLSLLALMSTYMLSIGCVLLRRLQRPSDGSPPLPLPLPAARWSLGRWGLPVNAVAVAYSGLVVVMSCFPDGAAPAPADANWAPAIWAAVVALSAVAYACHGRRHFTPPVMFVEGRRGEGVEVQKVD